MSFLEYFNQIYAMALTLYINNCSEVKNESVRAIFKEQLEKKVAPDIFGHLDDMAAFADHFGDQQSMNDFAKELLFLSFGRINFKFAEFYLSPLNASQFEVLKAKHLTNIEANNFPKFKNAGDSNDIYPLFTTFIMRQYVYDLPDREHGKFEISKGQEVVLNCGACTGDSTLWFLMEGAKEVHSFEPMPAAFEQLKVNLQDNGYSTDQVYQLAVGNDNCELVFKQDLSHIGASSQLDEFQKKEYDKCKERGIECVPNKESAQFVTAQCVKLDDWLVEHKITPTFIKMDLEGAEPQALEGLTKTITELKPKLAICLYHRPSDMWTIPQQILKMNPNYTFYCKKSMTNAEFVLFAIQE